ncbi:FAD-binding oxidoreductase [Rheinheimera maricola]|uniref:FAD-binding oxidoreductase n=1 Tax=Rheinheimera maricola TaxID=2793282 RepID=A0ABS7XBS1_9GAMM|nr:FAD-binding oxidoreductase [Rheinheimera maricola]MBZ9612999.1 FAD-binding oxidoreductase [Rheinheimera maricola]
MCQKPEHVIRVNDVHAKLNSTVMQRCIQPVTVAEVITAVQQANKDGSMVIVAGGRHAMGGQQFVTGGVLLDLSKLNQLQHFDAELGQVSVQAGIQWPDLMRKLHVMQHGCANPWGIRQKQTGADRLSVGGAIAANIHGRGLDMAPFVADVVSFELVNADGELLHCSRQSNAELFRLVVGGYGLFGIVVTATLQLVPRQQVVREVELCSLADMIKAVPQRVQSGYLYGDFQFETAPESAGFLRHGVFSCYKPVAARPIAPQQLRLSKANWQQLLYQAHTDKAAAFEQFSQFYLTSHGQRYWSDSHQLSIYLDDYHLALDKQLGRGCAGSEMITELYVPQAALQQFMADCAADFRQHQVDLIYGTVRFIRQDSETALAWAKQDYACVIFNLHIDHHATAIDTAAGHFRRLIDIAIRYKGSYFLTYHPFATKQQLLACYPNFVEFLQAKRRYDPAQRLQSNWYRHYSALFSQEAV